MTLSLPVDYLDQSRREWRADFVLGELRPLIATLTSLGVRITHRERFDELMDATGLPLLPPPESVLALSPDQYRAAAEAEGVRRASLQHSNDALWSLGQQAMAEMRESMAAEADDLIRQLRPAFDQAGAAGQACIDLGITSADTPETVMERGPEASQAWLTFARKGRQVQVLNQIAAARIQMSRALGIFPVKGAAGDQERIDYAVCFTLPYSGGFNGGKGDWRQWIDMAPNLHLTTSDEITREARLIAVGEGRFL